MKIKEIIFKRPVIVIQVFRNINVYGKPQKSFEDRKAEMEWSDVYSKAGHVLNNELYLPEEILKKPDLKTCDLITIEDDMQSQTFTSTDLMSTRVFSSNHTPVYNQCFYMTHPNKLDIFEIRKNEEIELYLHYGYFEVGIPERKNFKLCDIKLNSPVEIKINGKTDHSMSSGRDRIFKEQHYIINYVGNFEKCMILKEPYSPTLKSIPTTTKVIDLIKTLW